MPLKELKEIAKKYNGKVAKLLSLGRNGLTRGKRISYVNKFGLNKDDIPQLLVLAQDMDIYRYDYSDIAEDEGLEFFGVIHAWYALSELKAPEFKEILINMIENVDKDECYDWIMDGFVELVAPYRKDMYDYFKDGILNEAINTWTRLCYMDAIKEMLKTDEVSLEEVKKLVAKILSDGEDDIVNASTLGICVDYKLVEYHELIKKCFDRNAIDLMYMGDLEDVEIRMGLRKERATDRKPTMLQKLFFDLKDHFDDEESAYVRESPKIGRNDPCPCGSGKKYKKCCINKLSIQDIEVL